MDDVETDRHDDGLVYRSSIDDRVWMCNIPDLDVASGIVASTSLRNIKAYVESKLGCPGDWKLSSEGTWAFFGREL